MDIIILAEFPHVFCTSIYILNARNHGPNYISRDKPKCSAITSLEVVHIATNFEVHITFV